MLFNTVLLSGKIRQRLWRLKNNIFGCEGLALIIIFEIEEMKKPTKKDVRLWKNYTQNIQSCSKATQ